MTAVHPIAILRQIGKEEDLRYLTMWTDDGPTGTSIKEHGYSVLGGVAFYWHTFEDGGWDVFEPCSFTNSVDITIEAIRETALRFPEN